MVQQHYVLILVPFNDIEYSYIRKRDGSFKNMKNFIATGGRNKRNNTTNKGVIIQAQTTVWNFIITAVIASVMVAFVFGVLFKVLPIIGMVIRRKVYEGDQGVFV